MYKLYTDGGSRGNPGNAAFGCVLFDDDVLLAINGGYLGKQTNNQAEYEALIAGMKLSKKNDVDMLVCYLDSELVVKQLKGEYKVKNGNIKPLFKKVQKKLDDFEAVTFEHVRREQNQFADKLVNICLDSVES